MSQQQPELRDLFALARAERAPEQAKERVRERVLEAAVVGVGVSATTAAVGTSLWKSALFGKLMGGLLLLGAVGGGLALHARVAPQHALPALATPAPRIAAEQPGSLAAAGNTPSVHATPMGPHTSGVSASNPVPAMAAVPAPSTDAQKAPSKPAPAALPPKPVAEGDLEREASLLSAARSALQEGNLAAAQQHLLARRQLAHRSLDPEALAVEAKVLRAQGNTDASTAREAELRLRVPEHSLAR
jgi:hypothetical protein